MAILKELMDNKGQVTRYHRISSFSPFYATPTPYLQVTLVSYTDEQYRNIEKTGQAQDSMFVSSTQVALPLSTDDSYSRGMIYSAIMALPEFEGSTEV